MEISPARNSFCLLRCFLRSWYKIDKIINRKRSTVELSHKIYGDLNEKAPIIILHGLLASKRNWNSMSQKLKDANNKTVIAVDARNHGESPHAPSHQYLDLAADVKRLMEKLLIKEATVLGHSMGGRTAMTLALTEPAKVQNLIVIDISPIKSPIVLNNFFPRFMTVLKSVKFDASVKNLAMARQLVQHKLQRSDLDVDFTPTELALMNVGMKDGKISWMCNVDVLKKYFGDIATFPTELAGKVYQGPTLFIAGEESDFIPSDDEAGRQELAFHDAMSYHSRVCTWAEGHVMDFEHDQVSRDEDIGAIKMMFPLSEVAYVAKAGHNVHVDKPEEFLKLVSIFIKEYAM